MTPGEIRKLLGGYATGTLSNEERNLLYSAALADQELFNALADEETLRELLAEPNTRHALIEELQRQPAPSMSPLENQRVPLQFTAPLLPPPLGPAANIKSAEPFWPQMWVNFLPRRLAVAGGIAMLLLIAGAIQYRRSHAPVEVAVNVPKARAPERSPSASEESNASRRNLDEEPMQRPIQRSATLAPPKETVRELADARLSGARSVEERRSTTGGAEIGGVTPPKDENRAAVQSSVAPDAAGADAKVEKEADNTGPARERLNQAVREQISPARPAEPVSVESSTPLVAAFSEPPANSSQVSAARSTPVSPAQIVSGGLRKAPSLLAPKSAALAKQSRRIDAKVTDMNGTIVSVNVGSNLGFSAGDTIEIVRDNRVIATSKLSQVGATFAVGPIHLAPGSTDTPRAGDSVRRAASSQPLR